MVPQHLRRYSWNPGCPDTSGVEHERRVVARRTLDHGSAWEAPVHLAGGTDAGSSLHDAIAGHSIVLAESSQPLAEKSIFGSADDCISRRRLEVTFLPDSRGNAPGPHMHESGIMLSSRRLIQAARVYASQKYGEGAKKRSNRGNH